MHVAPAVRMWLGRSPGWVAFVALTGAAAAASWVGWLLALTGASMSPWAPFAAAVSGGLLAGAVAWYRQAPGTLNWDGAEWRWDERSGDAQVAVDLGRWMLLRFSVAPGNRCWIAASRPQARGAWPALRAALYSRRPADPPDAPPA